MKRLFTIAEKAVILRGLLEVKEGRIGQAIAEKVDIDELIEKVKEEGEPVIYPYHK